MADEQANDAADDEELIFDDRRTPRAQVAMPGAVAHSGESYPCRIVDLSAGGCRAEVDVEFAPGMPVHVELGEHGRFPAVVIWSEGKVTGLAFAESVGQTLARLGPTAVALGLISSEPGSDGDTGVPKLVDPT